MEETDLREQTKNSEIQQDPSQNQMNEYEVDKTAFLTSLGINPVNTTAENQNNTLETKAGISKKKRLPPPRRGSRVRRPPPNPIPGHIMFQCKISTCGNRYMSMASLNQHTKECHVPRVKCPRRCGYSCPLDRNTFLMRKHLEKMHGYLPQQRPLTTPATVAGSSSRTTATSTLSMPLITSSATTSHTSLGVMVTEPPAAALATLPPTSICSTNSNHNTCSNAVGPFLPACSTTATLPSSDVAPVWVLPNASAPSIVPVSMPSEEMMGSTDNVRGRAVTLLKNGGMPLFPPARRDWDSVEEESVRLTETLSWPPRGWTNFSKEQKVTASEFAMYCLFSHTGQIIGQSKSYIFDMFNFMKLPGCGKCKSEREHSVESKMRLYNLLKLKQIAVGTDKEGSLEIVQMYENSVAGYRSTAADQFLEIIKDVPLRLSK